jgi:hypothetical protein
MGLTLKFQSCTYAAMCSKFYLGLLIIFTSATLPAQSITGYRFEPYSPDGRVECEMFRLFVGQIPRYLSSHELVGMLNRVARVSVVLESHHPNEGYGFIVVSGAPAYERLVALNKRISCRSEGYSVLDAPSGNQHCLVIEPPRRNWRNAFPNELW